MPRASADEKVRLDERSAWGCRDDVMEEMEKGFAVDREG